MEIFKYETNYKRKLFLNKKEIKPKKYSEKLKNEIINIYPELK